MKRVEVPQELFDVVVDNGPAAWFPRRFSAAMAKWFFRVVDDRETRLKFGYEETAQ
ncbi:hypothetical protein AB0876_31550 [Mycobacterium sp. NPDC049093]